MGPTTPSQGNAPAAGGKWPAAGMRPGVGLSPQMPQKWAGTRMEPPPSEPMPATLQPEEMAAASPPLEPPEEWARFQGLEVELLAMAAIALVFALASVARRELAVS